MDNGLLYNSVIASYDENLWISALDLQAGAKGFQISNQPVLECCCLWASLQVFEQTSMSQLVRKSRVLTGYLELLLERGLASRNSRVTTKSRFL